MIRSTRLARSVAGSLAIAALSVGCSGSDQEQTNAELLTEIEGRPLTEVEVAELEQAGRLLCGLDDAVLTEIWSRLSAAQFEFQDFVFDRLCSDRGEFYRETTGRGAAPSDEN